MDEDQSRVVSLVSWYVVSLESGVWVRQELKFEMSAED